MINHQAAAHAALNALVEARAWLTEVTATGATRPGAVPQRLTTRTAAARDQLLRVEKAERAHQPRDTHIVGASPAPVDVALIDAAITADRALIDAAWIATNNLPSTAGLTLVAPTTASNATWRLHTVLDQVDDPTAREVGELLAAADRHVRTVIGCGPAWIPVPGVACPACPGGPRHLEAEVSSPDEREWTIRCRAARMVDRVTSAAIREHADRDLIGVLASISRHHRRHRSTA